MEGWNDGRMENGRIGLGNHKAEGKPAKRQEARVGTPLFSPFFPGWIITKYRRGKRGLDALTKEKDGWRTERGKERGEGMMLKVCPYPSPALFFFFSSFFIYLYKLYFT
eukprot:Phypoly_transcript_14772.p1 GENE.Phypoly_transcript_14772~~Phypoly_transcript_14772.p1  ORF type:complete len:109 (-),score=18.69 Phypoly_transcript_14772:171-497(-)